MPAIRIQPVPISYKVQNRFMAAVTSETSVHPTYHGTDQKNFDPIFENGLLIPSRSNGVQVANGQVHGRGIYSAMLRNPRLALGFATGKASAALDSPASLECFWRESFKGLNAACEAFLGKLSVERWDTLQLASWTRMAVVDAVSWRRVHETGPSQCRGQSAELYKCLGIGKDKAFPDDVRAELKSELDATFHSYCGCKVIHAIGPDLRKGSLFGISRRSAVHALSRCYRNIFVKFAQSGLSQLRLQPVSGQLFSGSYMSEIPKMTIEAISLAICRLSPDMQQQLLNAEVMLCINTYPHMKYDPRRYCFELQHNQMMDYKSLLEPYRSLLEPSSLGSQFHVDQSLLLCGVAMHKELHMEEHNYYPGYRCGDSGSVVKCVGDALLVSREDHIAPLFVVSLGHVPMEHAPATWRNVRHQHASCYKSLMDARRLLKELETQLSEQLEELQELLGLRAEAEKQVAEQLPGRRRARQHTVAAQAARAAQQLRCEEAARCRAALRARQRRQQLGRLEERRLKSMVMEALGQ